MPSDCIVPVVEVRNVREHPNADMLSIVEVLGYQMVTGLVEDPEGPMVREFFAGVRDERGRRVPWPRNPEVTDLRPEDYPEKIRYSFRYRGGDRAVYFPADTVLTDEWAEEFGVKPYLGSGNRVRRARLRGEPSFGLIVALPDGVDWEVGQNAADYYNCTKWEPPADKATAPDAAPYDSEIDPHFAKYTDIQNGLIFYEKFLPGELVIATEKIHGRNCRIGIINGIVVCGSRTSRKIEESGSIFWQPFWIPGVEALLRAAEDETGAVNIILYGEVYGQGVQSLHYGCGKKKGFRAFDLYADGDFFDYPEFKAICDRFGVETVPELFIGAFDLEGIKKVSNGRSALPGADNIREGVVVRTMKERRDPAIGRVVLKFISTDYELSKHKKKDTTDL